MTRHERWLLFLTGNLTGLGYLARGFVKQKVMGDAPGAKRDAELAGAAIERGLASLNGPPDKLVCECGGSAWLADALEWQVVTRVLCPGCAARANAPAQMSEEQFLAAAAERGWHVRKMAN